MGLDLSFTPPESRHDPYNLVVPDATFVYELVISYASVAVRNTYDPM